MALPDRPIVPIGVYEEVLPLNFLPAMLKKYCSQRILEKISGSLGGLELDEEDLSLYAAVLCRVNMILDLY